MVDFIRIQQRVSRRGVGLAVAALALAHSGSALAQAAASAPPPAAQTPAANPPEDSNQSYDDIVVTGSRVARLGFSSPTPLTVLSQQDILTQSPTNNLADFVNELPSMTGSTRPSNSRLNLSDGTAGINALSLRNLGPSRTLVLLDGRRSPASSITGLVDINTIPQMLVKSVEVVTGGASAAYGSDAVAGVVNFVLDKQFEGLKLSADSGITTYGDDYNYSFSGAFGKSFAGGRGHILLSGEWAHRDGIFQVNRAWDQLGYRDITNPNYTATNGQPRELLRWGAGTWNAQPGGMVISTNGITTFSNQTYGLNGTYFGPGGSLNAFNFGSLTSSGTTLGGDWQLADNTRNLGLDAADDRRGAFGRVSYEVAPWIELYAEVGYNWQKSLFNAGQQLITSGLTLKSDNAYLINTVGASTLAALGVNTVGIGTTAVNMPYRETNNARSVQRYTIGGDGKFQAFGKDALWSAYAQYGQTDTHEQLINIMNTARRTQATDAVFASDGSGTIVCRDPSNGCIPIDWLGTGVMNPAAVNWILGNPYRNQKLTEWDAGVNLSVTPFRTWAGDVSVAVGGEWRREAVTGYVPTQYQTGWQVGNYLPTVGSYDVKEAYLETVVPLGLGLEFNGAVRATDYSTSGYVTTWKTGLTWQPIQDIRLRFTQSRDIRAPNLSELYAAGTASSDSVLDTRNGLNQNVTYISFTSGNPNLLPEKANSTSAGLVLTPRFLPGLSFSADWYHIKIDNAIYTYGVQDIVNRCAEGHQNFCAAITDGSAYGRVLAIANTPFNAASLTSSGVDLDLSYRLPLDKLFARTKGSLTLRGLATRYINYTVNTGIAGVVPVNVVGDNSSGVPKWIYHVSLTYEDPSFSATVVGRGVSAGTYGNSNIVCQAPNCPTSTTQNVTYDANSISGAFYTDLNLTAKIGDSLFGQSQVFLSVTDLFNRWPILLPQSNIGANTTYSDLLGRTFRVGVRFQMK